MPDNHDPHEWPKRQAIIISTDVLSALLQASASFYKLIVQAQQEERITFDRWVLSEHELIALHIAGLPKPN